MSKVADQVATLESDLDAALAEIDQLKAANAAFDSANASLRRDNVALQLEVNDMKHFVDDARSMADRLATMTLDLLRASRRQVGTPAAPVPAIRTDHLTKEDLATIKDRGLDAKIAALPEKWPEQKAVAETMAREEQDAGNANAISSETPETVTLTIEQVRKIHDPASEMRGAPTAMHYARDKDGPLPIFLQRDPPFAGAGNVRPIFG